MDMEPGRLLVCQEHAGMMIKLDDDDGALDAEVEGVGISKPADPAEIRLGEEALDVFEAKAAGGLRQVQQVFVEDGVDEGLLGGSQLADQDAFVRHDAVVAVRAAHVSLVVVVPAALGHRRVLELLVDLGLGLLVRRERLHQFQSRFVFHLQNPCAFVRARVDDVGLRACEPRRDDDLRLVQEDVQAQVVPVETEAPGVRAGGFAKQDEVVRVFVHHGWGFHQLTEEPVDAHGRSRFLVSLW